VELGTQWARYLLLSGETTTRGQRRGSSCAALRDTRCSTRRQVASHAAAMPAIALQLNKRLLDA
jgi:hypothetical protein